MACVEVRLAPGDPRDPILPSAGTGCWGPQIENLSPEMDLGGGKYGIRVGFVSGGLMGVDGKRWELMDGRFVVRCSGIVVISVPRGRAPKARRGTFMTTETSLGKTSRVPEGHLKLVPRPWWSLGACRPV
ncbi:hypothetical protein CRG98_046569 [Punica granatum]|uniref:Uncharacterized protein n=1 Tax=Punica granatum TaxID=22663 RepID=A0A2I0HNK1_PUNGR|nr:hypothetical protein CRG98_046569 [Punica granatum]